MKITDTLNSFTLVYKVDIGGQQHSCEEYLVASWKHMCCDLQLKDDHKFISSMWNKTHIYIVTQMRVDIYKNFDISVKCTT